MASPSPPCVGVRATPPPARAPEDLGGAPAFLPPQLNAPRSVLPDPAPSALPRHRCFSVSPKPRKIPQSTLRKHFSDCVDLLLQNAPLARRLRASRAVRIVCSRLCLVPLLLAMATQLRWRRGTRQDRPARPPAAAAPAWGSLARRPRPLLIPTPLPDSCYLMFYFYPPLPTVERVTSPVCASRYLLLSYNTSRLGILTICLDIHLPHQTAEEKRRGASSGKPTCVRPRREGTGTKSKGRTKPLEMCRGSVPEGSDVSEAS